jgi:hypothetical protein
LQNVVRGGNAAIMQRHDAPPSPWRAKALRQAITACAYGPVRPCPFTLITGGILVVKPLLSIKINHKVPAGTRTQPIDSIMFF